MQTSPIVDRQSRRRLAELLRHLATGLITNDEFDDRRPRGSKDLALRQVFAEGAWFLYSDSLRPFDQLAVSGLLQDSQRT